MYTNPLYDQNIVDHLNKDQMEKKIPSILSDEEDLGNISLSEVLEMFAWLRRKQRNLRSQIEKLEEEVSRVEGCIERGLHSRQIHNLFLSELMVSDLKQIPGIIIRRLRLNHIRRVSQLCSITKEELVPLFEDESAVLIIEYALKGFGLHFNEIASDSERESTDDESEIQSDNENEAEETEEEEDLLEFDDDEFAEFLFDEYEDEDDEYEEEDDDDDDDDEDSDDDEDDDGAGEVSMTGEDVKNIQEELEKIFDSLFKKSGDNDE